MRVGDGATAPNRYDSISRGSVAVLAADVDLNVVRGNRLLDLDAIARLVQRLDALLSTLLRRH